MKKATQRNFYHTQISAQKISFIAKALDNLNIPRSEVFESDDIVSAIDNQTLSTLSGQEIVNIYRNIASLKIATLGLKIGKQIGCGHYGLYGCVLLCRESLLESLKFSIKYHSLATRTTRLYLQDSNNQNVIFGCEDILDQPELKQFNLELQAAINLTLVREIFANNDLAPQKVYLEFAEPKDSEPYREFFKCPVLFKQPFSGLEFSQQQLVEQPLKKNPLAVPVLMKTCNQELGSILELNQFLQQIYEWISQHIHSELQLGHLAEHMCLTSRTLRRRLAEYDTSFNSICAEVKCRFAKKYIGETKLSIDDIANSLGFKETANFRRAFKTWTRVTPTQYRNQMSEQL